jgi:hypothetical protein
VATGDVRVEVVSSSKSPTRLANAKAYGDQCFPRSADGTETYTRYVVRVETEQVVA